MCPGSERLSFTSIRGAWSGEFLDPLFCIRTRGTGPPPDPLFSTGQTCAKRPLYNGRIWQLRSIVFYWPNKSSKTTIEARGCNTIRRAPRGCHPIRRTSPEVALQESPRVSVHGLYSRISGRRPKKCFFLLASPYTMGHDWGK